jgi:hypothetical protein
LFGWGYVKNTCVALFKKKQTTLYFAEVARCIAENTAKYAGGSYIKQRLADILDPPPPETRTPEQIYARMESVFSAVRGDSQNEPV